MIPLLSAGAEAYKLMTPLRRQESKIVQKCFKLSHNMFSFVAFAYQPQCQLSVKRSAVEASGNCNPCFICSAKVILVSASTQGQSSLFLSIYLYVLSMCTINLTYKKMIQKKPQPKNQIKIPRNISSACLNFSEAKENRTILLFCLSFHLSIYPSINFVIYSNISKPFPGKINN